MRHTSLPHRVAVVALDVPLSARLAGAWRYPLHGAALSTIVALTLSHYVAFLPSFIGVLASLVVWTATWRYAADCLLHSANGYAEPPEVSVAASAQQGWTLTGTNFVLYLLMLVCAFAFPMLFWVMVLFCVIVLPAIDMSLAYDGNLLHAFYPVTWIRIIGGFGVAYLLPLAIQALLGVSLVFTVYLSAFLPRVIGIPLTAFVSNYLVILVFHIMGTMLHQRHDVFGLRPQAQLDALANHQDADEALLVDVDALARHDRRAAIGRLAARMQDRASPTAMHLTYRQLLRAEGLTDALLSHGQIWITALIANDQERRALGLVQECSEWDPQFLPDDPDNAGKLIDLAARSGMNRLAVRMSRSFIAVWPHDPRGPLHMLSAAHQLAGPLQQPTEALVMISRTASQWPDHPAQPQIQDLIAQLRDRRLSR